MHSLACSPGNDRLVDVAAHLLNLSEVVICVRVLSSGAVVPLIGQSGTSCKGWLGHGWERLVVMLGFWLALVVVAGIDFLVCV